jgi:hypothetical protein
MSKTGNQEKKRDPLLKTAANFATFAFASAASHLISTPSADFWSIVEATRYLQLLRA